MAQEEFDRQMADAGGSCLGLGPVPKVDPGRNCETGGCSFPFWTSPALTHAFRARALVRAAQLLL